MQRLLDKPLAIMSSVVLVGFSVVKVFHGPC